MNPALWLTRTAQKLPEAPALMSGTRVDASYQQFARSAAAIGRSLQSRGIARGARVAVFMANSTAYLEALYGIWFAGAVAVPINAKLHAREAAWIMGDAGTRLVFADTTRAEDLAAVMGDKLPQVVDPAGGDFAAMRASEPLDAPAAMAFDDLLWLFYTSGTTGKPKSLTQKFFRHNSTLRGAVS